MSIISKTAQFAKKLNDLHFSNPVEYVYNPLDYAWSSARIYLKLYAASKKEVLLVGMNPGPWGMVQSGIPFGHLPLVKEWLGIDNCSVEMPKKIHPKRPVDGYSCKRGEISGKRLWGWAKNSFSTPEIFFSKYFVVNYCPLAFFSADGGNITPDKIALGDRDALYNLCDNALVDVVTELKPDIVIGIGGFAAKRVKASLQSHTLKIGQITHPSPANPKANRGWEQLVTQELKEYGL